MRDFQVSSFVVMCIRMQHENWEQGWENECKKRTEIEETWILNVNCNRMTKHITTLTPWMQRSTHTKKKRTEASIRQHENEYAMHSSKTVNICFYITNHIENRLAQTTKMEQCLHEWLDGSDGGNSK